MLRRSIHFFTNHAVTANLSKYVLSFSTLEAIWRTAKGSGISVFNTIFENNYLYSASDKPTMNNIVTSGGSSLPG